MIDNLKSNGGLHLSITRAPEFGKLILKISQPWGLQFAIPSYPACYSCPSDFQHRAIDAHLRPPSFIEAEFPRSCVTD
jgi:hypothetical protein